MLCSLAFFGLIIAKMISLLRASRGKKPHDELKIKDLSEILTQAKNHYLMKSALQLARQVMDNLHFFFFL